MLETDEELPVDMIDDVTFVVLEVEFIEVLVWFIEVEVWFTEVEVWFTTVVELVSVDELELDLSNVVVIVVVTLVEDVVVGLKVEVLPLKNTETVLEPEFATYKYPLEESYAMADGCVPTL